MEETKIVERLIENEQCCKSNTHQIHELKEDIKEIANKTDDIHRIATSVEVIATKMDTQEKKIDKLDSKIDSVEAKVSDIESQPAKNYKALTFECIKWLIIFGLGYFINLLIK